MQGTIKNWIPAFAGMTNLLEALFRTFFKRQKYHKIKNFILSDFGLYLKFELLPLTLFQYYFVFRLAKISKGSPRTKAASAQRL